MKSPYRWMTLAVTLTLALVSATSAQVRGRHQGLWITGGMGFGSAKISCAECEDGDLGSGPTATLGLGLGISQRLFLGAEVTGWFKESNGINDRAGFAALTLRYYPLVGRQFYVGGGAGFGRHRTGVKREGALSDREGLTQSALAWRLESGYDVLLGNQFVLTPNASYNRTMSSDLKKDGSSLDVSAAFSVVEFGVTLSWRWTFPPLTSP